MRFMIERNGASYIKPCDRAFEQAYSYIDERTVDDPVKVPSCQGRGGWWYAEGAAHRVEKGHIKRDLVRRAWFINLTIDELVGLARAYEQVVIQPAPENPSIMKIVLGRD